MYDLFLFVSCELCNYSHHFIQVVCGSKELRTDYINSLAAKVSKERYFLPWSYSAPPRVMSEHLSSKVGSPSNLPIAKCRLRPLRKILQSMEKHENLLKA